MATPRDHILDDMAALFAGDAAEVIDLVIDDVPIRAIDLSEEENPAEFVGEMEKRKRLLFLPGDISCFVGNEIEIDGERWRVTAVANAGVLQDVRFSRYGS